MPAATAAVLSRSAGIPIHPAGRAAAGVMRCKHTQPPLRGPLTLWTAWRGPLAHRSHQPFENMGALLALVLINRHFCTPSHSGRPRRHPTSRNHSSSLVLIRVRRPKTHLSLPKYILRSTKRKDQHLFTPLSVKFLATWPLIHRNSPRRGSKNRVFPPNFTFLACPLALWRQMGRIE